MRDQYDSDGITTYEVGRHEFDNAILQNIEVKGSIMEVGCGNGRFLDKLQMTNPKVKIAGLDSSEAGIAVCRQRVQGEFVCADIQTYATDARYDFVMCFNTIEHFLNPYLVIANMIRMLKPKGRLILTVPNADMDRCQDHRWFWNHRELSMLMGQYFNFFTVQMIDGKQNLLAKGWNTEKK